MKLSIETLPNILIFQLKRFSLDAQQKIHKIMKHIHFPLALTLPENVLKSNLKNQNSYNLFAVVSHHGDYISNGHYTCYSKTLNSHWIHFDDEKLTRVQEKDVLRSNAYLLFYER